MAKIRDPALLEFIGYNLIRSSVFPVEANGTQKVRLTYEHVCPADGQRIDYVLPRSESLDYKVPWEIRVTVKSKRLGADPTTVTVTVATSVPPWPLLIS